MIRKLFFLPLIFVFLSCTVTKRVHRSGYHIQWHKVERTQKVEKQKLKITEGIPDSPQTETPLELAEIKPIQNQLIQPEIISDKSHHQSQRVVINNNTIKASIDAQKSDDIESELTLDDSKKPYNQQAVRPIFWRTPAENLRKLGIAFMILGGMILFATLLVYVGAFSGNGDGAWVNFFLDLIDISGWFWLLFFILAFLLVSYILFLFVIHVLGGPIGGLIVGTSLLAIGLFFYILGKRRVVEP